MLTVHETAVERLARKNFRFAGDRDMRTFLDVKSPRVPAAIFDVSFTKDPLLVLG